MAGNSATHHAERLIEAGVDALTLFKGTLHAGIEIGALHVLRKEILRRLAEPENEIHRYFHRHPNQDGSPGGWVQNRNCASLQVDPSAHIGPDALILGAFSEESASEAASTSISAGTTVRGRSVIGPGVHTRGAVLIEHALTCGVEVLDGALLHRGLLHKKTLGENRVNLSGAVDLMECRIENATLSQSIAAGSVLRDATVKERATVAFSIVQNSEVDGANLHCTTVKDGGKVGKEVTASNCEIKNAVVDGPRILADKKIDDDRYALHPRPKPSRFRHLLEELKHSFSRAKKGAEGVQAGPEAAK